MLHQAAIIRELARKELPKTQPEMLAELGKLPENPHAENGPPVGAQITLPGM
jgi:hypothetical protein